MKIRDGVSACLNLLEMWVFFKNKNKSIFNCLGPGLSGYGCWL